MAGDAWPGIEATAFYRRKGRQLPSLDPGEIDRDRTTKAAIPPDQLERRETTQRLLRAISGLPEKYRQVLLMACQGRMSYDDMAATLDVPVTTIQIRLVRARQMVQERLAGKEQIEDSENMNMANEMLDLLMGKLLDGEITPDEQRLLDRFLATDETAGRSSDCSDGCTSRRAGPSGRRWTAVSRWKRSSMRRGGSPRRLRRLRNRLFRREWVLAAAGLAAGLLLGFLIHGWIVAPGDSPADTGAAGAESDTPTSPFRPQGQLRRW